MSLLQLIIIVIVIIFIIWWLRKRESLVSTTESPIYYNDIPRSLKRNKIKNQENWEEHLANSTISPEDKARHVESMVKQVPIFSGGASYSIVEPDNTSPSFTNYVGLFRPAYVPILDGQRQVVDIDTEQLKKNKRAFNI